MEDEQMEDGGSEITDISARKPGRKFAELIDFDSEMHRQIRIDHVRYVIQGSKHLETIIEFKSGSSVSVRGTLDAVSKAVWGRVGVARSCYASPEINPFDWPECTYEEAKYFLDNVLKALADSAERTGGAEHAQGASVVSSTAMHLKWLETCVENRYDLSTIANYRSPHKTAGLEIAQEIWRTCNHGKYASAVQQQEDIRRAANVIQATLEQLAE